jgi:hypothetical protein
VAIIGVDTVVRRGSRASLVSANTVDVENVTND